MQGCVAVVAAEMPDVLSHAAVRARNYGALMAACLSPARYAELQSLEGSFVRLSPSQACACQPRKFVSFHGPAVPRLLVDSAAMGQPLAVKSGCTCCVCNDACYQQVAVHKTAP